MKLQKDETRRTALYFLLFFSLPVCTAFLLAGGGKLLQMSAISYAYHLVDYSFGFCTKFLTGALFHLFTDSLTIRQAEIAENILLIVYLAAAGALLTHMLRTSPPDKRRTLLVFSVFFLTGPSTFAIFAEELGMLDALWLPICIAALLCAQNKFLCWLVPPLCGACVLVHVSAAISYLLFIGLMLLWLLAEKKHMLRTGLALLLSVLVAGGLAAYFAKNETNNLTYKTREAFDRQLASRTIDVDPYTAYYDYALYGKSYAEGFDDFSRTAEAEEKPGQSLRNLRQSLKAQFGVTFAAYRSNRADPRQFPCLAALLSPLLVYITRFWLWLIRSSRGDRLRRLTAALCIAQFYITLIGGCLSSPDVVRWTAHAFLIQCALFLFILSRTDVPRETLQKLFHVPVPNWCTGLYFGMYASLTLWPYC